jgi:NAD-dependent deacetylase
MALIGDHIVQRCRPDTAIVAFTGAGMSAESGVPTFRGPDGIWNKFKPEELASMSAFMRNPELVWEWYAHRRAIIDSVEPNEGHRALVRLERFVASVTVVTQNIDNLHRRAGSTSVHELHGNIERSYCMSCGAAAQKLPAFEKGKVPRCACGGIIRPDVVWFGEMLPEEEWEASVKAAERADVFISIGTSAVVYPAASLPTLARAAGAYLIEINPEPTPLTPHVDEFLCGPAGVVIPALVERIAAGR